MKQVFLSGKGQVAVFEAPVPARLTNGVLVQSAFSVISSGTEGSAVTSREGLPGLYEKFSKSRDRLDQVWDMVKKQGVGSTLSLIENKLGDFTPLGYSLSGVVVETDGDATGFRPGDRVACMGAGLANHAEYASIPKNLAVRIPNGVRFEDAAFGAIACIAMQGLRRLELEPGEQVAIVGLGLIGQIAFRLAHCMGYRPQGFDVDQARVDAAKALEIGAVTNSADAAPTATAQSVTGGNGFDGVLVCASAKSDSLINQVCDMCRKRGRVSIVGDIGLGLERARVYAKELEIRLSCSYGVGRYDPEYELEGKDYPLPYVRWTERRNLEYFLTLIAGGQLDISDLVSKTFPIAEANKAYAAIKSGETATFGVLLDYGLPEQPTKPSQGSFVRYKERTSGKDTLSVGLVGVGAYAKNVHVPNLAKIPNASIVGVASRSGGSAGVVARKTKASFATSDSKELVESDEVNAVVVSTRHASHAAIVLSALQASKHVFVEKPMSTTTEDCHAIVAAQERAGKVVRVGYNRRFSPMLRSMKSFIGSGVKVFTQRVSIGNLGQHWSNTAGEGGRLLGEGVHFFDLANWIMDGFPRSVLAQFVGEADALNPNVAITMRYADGSVATVTYTTLGSVEGSKEFFELFGNNRGATLSDYKTLETFGDGRPVGRPAKGDKGQLGAMTEFVDSCLGTKSDGGADAIAGLWATAIFEAALESGQSGQAIDMAEFIAARRPQE